ncbi:MAG: carbohydrate ABC transporter permease [Alphaproteobacteria bacterium]|nr:MAG: carbohydrate ABC transporter permease [Alphaproteobacteria bacterium]
MTIALETIHQSSAGTKPAPGWFRENRSAIVRHGVINFFMLIILAPLVWVLMMSIKSRSDAMRSDFWPRRFDFTHYRYVFDKIDTFPINLLNSIYVTSGTVLITTVCAVLAGYALVHMKPKGGGLVVATLLISLYFPVRVVSTSGLILPYVTLNLAISVLIMRSVFQLVPHEVVEAAKVDGAGPWRTLWEIVLPMARNGLVVIFIVNFVTAWGEFLLCSTLTNDQIVRTMPVVLAGAQGGLGQWSWPALAAVYVLVVTPGIIAFTFAQKLFFKGLAEGVVKG